MIPQKRVNPVRLAVLGGLTASKAGSRTHKVWDRSANDGKGDVVETTITLPEAPTMPLARNVSDQNINALAKRWAI